MNNLKKELAELGFVKSGNLTIVAKKNHPLFDLINPNEKKEGHVYLWVVERKGDPWKIIYIGKAGKTLFGRCKQHVGGFRGGSKSGKRNAAEIIKYLEQKNTSIAVYSRYSKKIRLFGQSKICLCIVEEKIILKLFAAHPLLNLVNVSRVDAYKAN